MEYFKTSQGALRLPRNQLMQTEEPHHIEFAESSHPPPTPGYRAVLRLLHVMLRPASYIEIGVASGATLALASPRTRSIGIDPQPMPTANQPANARLFEMTSDEFFACHDLTSIVGSDHFDLAFIDGLHLFDQVLRDFASLEHYASKSSIILIHDCLPRDRITSERKRTTTFWTGDVWKSTLCLRELRHDLHIQIIPARPSGLCVISNLDRASETITQHYDDCVSKYLDLTFDDYRQLAPRMPTAIPNNWGAIYELCLRLAKHS
jgi:predicted O-methyltransferase YrrM